MAQIFISYSRADRAVVEALSALLTAEGYDVWWDTALESGADFDQTIRNVIATAPAAVILWSTTSIESDWVRAEAEEARQHRSAMPVVIDDLSLDRLPLVFKGLHTISMRGWRGGADDRGYAELLAAIRRRLGAPGHAGSAATSVGTPVRKFATSRRWVVAGLAALVIGAAAIAMVMSMQGRTGPDPTVCMDDAEQRLTLQAVTVCVPVDWTLEAARSEGFQYYVGTSDRVLIDILAADGREAAESIRTLAIAAGFEPSDVSMEFGAESVEAIGTARWSLTMIGVSDGTSVTQWRAYHFDGAPEPVTLLFPDSQTVGLTAERRRILASLGTARR